MTYDLRQGLTALGDAERAVAPALPVDVLITRARRKRMAHAATYSAIGVGAAAAVTIGAIAANGALTDRAPIPPATGAPTTTPTRTPGATPTTTPTTTTTEAAWAPNWGLCGMPAEDFYGRDIGWVEDASQEFFLSSDLLLPDSALPMDEPLTLQMRVLSWGLPQRDADVRIADVVALDADPFTGEGQVVAVAAVPTDTVTHGTLAEGDGMPLDPAQVTLTACTASPLTGGDGSLDAALPDGTYQAEAVAEVTTTDGIDVLIGWLGYLGEMPVRDEPQANNPSGESTIREIQADGPYPVAVDSPNRLPVLHGWGHSGAYASEDMEELCGTVSTPWPTAWLATHGAENGWREPPPPGTTNPFSLSATGFRDGGELIVRVTTTNAGPTVSDAWIASPGVTVVKNGRIVGWRHMWNMAYAPATWGSGQTVQLEMDLGEFTCTFMMGEPWPSGTYEVYVQETMDLLPQAGYPERWRSGVVGGPFTFTLD